MYYYIIIINILKFIVPKILVLLNYNITLDAWLGIKEFLKRSVLIKGSVYFLTVRRL